MALEWLWWMLSSRRCKSIELGTHLVSCADSISWRRSLTAKQWDGRVWPGSTGWWCLWWWGRWRGASGDRSNAEDKFYTRFQMWRSVWLESVEGRAMDEWGRISNVKIIVWFSGRSWDRLWTVIGVCFRMTGHTTANGIRHGGRDTWCVICEESG